MLGPTSTCAINTAEGKYKGYLIIIYFSFTNNTRGPDQGFNLAWLTGQQQIWIWIH